LFTQLPIDAQRHSLSVLEELQRVGLSSRDLAVAALLHDVGKLAAAQAGVHISLWLRGPLVLLEQAPRLVRWLASARPQAGWRYALHVHNAHAQIGAQWAQERGCSELSCWLIEHHQDKLATGTFDSPAVDGQDERLKLLRSLQWADGRN
jgi:predicted HD phosphohydrolase